MATSYQLRRAAIARSLLELEKMFGRKPTDEKQNAQRELGVDETGISELLTHNSTPFPNFQAAWGST
jgi:hypothetical protein